MSLPPQVALTGGTSNSTCNSLHQRQNAFVGSISSASPISSAVSTNTTVAYRSSATAVALLDPSTTVDHSRRRVAPHSSRPRRQQHQQVPVGRILCLIVAAFVVLFGGLWGYLYVTHHVTEFHVRARRSLLLGSGAFTDRDEPPFSPTPFRRAHRRGHGGTGDHQLHHDGIPNRSAANTDACDAAPDHITVVVPLRAGLVPPHVMQLAAETEMVIAAASLKQGNISARPLCHPSRVDWVFVAAARLDSPAADLSPDLPQDPHERVDPTAPTEASPLTARDVVDTFYASLVEARACAEATLRESVARVTLQQRLATASGVMTLVDSEGYLAARGSLFASRDESPFSESTSLCSSSDAADSAARGRGESSVPTLGRLLARGVLCAPRETSHVLFLSPYLAPESPATFIATLSSHFITSAAAVGAVQCAIVSQPTRPDISRSAAQVVDDAGWTFVVSSPARTNRRTEAERNNAYRAGSYDPALVAIADASLFVANRHAGYTTATAFPPETKTAVVDVVNFACAMAPRKLLLAAGAPADTAPYRTDVDTLHDDGVVHFAPRPPSSEASPDATPQLRQWRALATLRFAEAAVADAVARLQPGVSADESVANVVAAVYRSLYLLSARYNDKYRATPDDDYAALLAHDNPQARRAFHLSERRARSWFRDRCPLLSEFAGKSAISLNDAQNFLECITDTVKRFLVHMSDGTNPPGSARARTPEALVQSHFQNQAGPPAAVDTPVGSNGIDSAAAAAYAATLDALAHATCSTPIPEALVGLGFGLHLRRWGVAALVAVDTRAVSLQHTAPCHTPATGGGGRAASANVSDACLASFGFINLHSDGDSFEARAWYATSNNSLVRNPPQRSGRGASLGSWANCNATSDMAARRYPAFAHLIAGLRLQTGVAASHAIDAVAPEVFHPWLVALRASLPAFAGAAGHGVANRPVTALQPRSQQETSASASIAPFYRVVWYTYCCGCCGFSAEIAHFVRPLSLRRPVSLMVGPECFCPGNPAGFEDTLARAFLSERDYAATEVYPGELVIWVSHTNPVGVNRGQLFDRRRPHYTIARSMYEFTRIPPEWDWVAGGSSDEIWAPSNFTMQIFLDAGVSSDRLVKIPEGVDTTFFSPAAHAPIRLSRRVVETQLVNSSAGASGAHVSASNGGDGMKRAPVEWEHVLCTGGGWRRAAYDPAVPLPGEPDLEGAPLASTIERAVNWDLLNVEREAAVAASGAAGHANVSVRVLPPRSATPGNARRSQAKWGDGEYVFFSNFKWEPRKGYDLLLQAYLDVFSTWLDTWSAPAGTRADGARGSNASNSDPAASPGASPRFEYQAQQDVTLLILTYMFHPDGVRPDESQYSAHYMLRDVVALARRLRPGVPLDALPRMCVIADAVTEYELAQLFRGADAFVLPTRGEGWGLPTLQAMSMGLPTVSTNWGGSVDFTTPETAFLVEVDAVEEVPLDSPYGHRPGLKWGQPSLAHLRQLMRYVYDHRAMAAAVGRRARRHVVAHFDDNVVVDAVTARFDEIARSLRGKQFGLGHGIYFPDG